MSASLRGQKRTESVHSSDSFSPSLMAVAVGGGAAAGGIDSDFKDTVLFMQQQQVMQHKELLSALTVMSGKMDAVAARGGSVSDHHPQPQHQHSAPHQPTVPQSEESFYDEVGEYVYPSGANYARQRIIKQPMSSAGGRNLVEDLQAAELRAARTRICDLEEQVRSLQRQLESKEDAIQRLSAAAVTNSSLKFSASDSVRRADCAQTPSRGGAGTQLTTGRGRDDGTSSVPFMLTPSKAIDEHEKSVYRLNNMSVTPISPSISSVGPHLSNLGQSISASSEIQARLKEHQHRCQLLTKR